MNQAKILMGSLSLLLVAVAVSCTRNLSVPVTAVVNTPTPTSTKTALATSTPTVTNTPSGPTSTFTNTFTPSFTATSTPTFTGTSTNTPTGPTATFTNTGTSTDTPTVTNTQTVTDTPTITNTPTLTATFTNTFTNTNTPTPTNTVAGPPPTATGTPNPNVECTDFDTEMGSDWPGWTSTSANNYQVSVYTQNATYNSGSINTTTPQAGDGALDLNVTFSATTGTLLEATIENSYGNLVDGTNGTGTNPSYVSFWIRPTATMTMAHIYIDAPAGTNTSFVNTTVCPAGVWTNVVQSLAAEPAGNMVNTKAIIIDMTCATATTVDVLYDSMYFYP